jgi:hypothetical protein
LPEAGAVSAPRRPAASVLPGRRTGRRHRWVPRELGRSWIVSRRFSPAVGDRLTNPRPAVARLGPQGSETTGAAPGSATRRKRSAVRGTQEVAQPHSTTEVGEPVPRGPHGGKGAVRQGLVSGQPGGGLDSGPGSTRGSRIAKRTAKPWRDEPDARVGHVRICGSPGRQLPGRPGRFPWGPSFFSRPHGQRLSPVRPLMPPPRSRCRHQEKVRCLSHLVLGEPVASSAGWVPT